MNFSFSLYNKSQVIENVQKNEASPVLDDSLENEEHLDDIVRNIPDTALPPLQVSKYLIKI